MLETIKAVDWAAALFYFLVYCALMILRICRHDGLRYALWSHYEKGRDQ